MIDNQDVSKLEELVRQYPYFTIGQALLAVGMNRCGDERTTQQIRKAASMSPNRNVLRKLCTQLPDEYIPTTEVNDYQQDITPEKTILIPEIDLGDSSDDIDREVALLEEKKKTLD